MRVGRRVAAVVAGVIAGGLLSSTVPARATTPRVVRLDPVEAVQTMNKCDNQPFDLRCETRLHGTGVAADNAMWVLDTDLLAYSTHACVGWNYDGTWSISEVGSQDSLFGVFTSNGGHPQWQVTGGTGSYSGATDADPYGGSSESGFSGAYIEGNPATDALGVGTGCYGANLIVLPIAGGFLEFHVN